MGSKRGVNLLRKAMHPEMVANMQALTVGAISGSANIAVGGNMHLSGSATIEGQVVSKKKTTYLEGNLDLSSVTTALLWTGAVIALDQNGGARVVTLPTATTAAEGTAITGWHIEVFNAYAGANDCTVVRGDTSNDYLAGMVASHAQDNLTGVTIGSNVITFVSGQSAEGDHARIVCYSADATNTYYIAYGLCST